MISKWIRLSQHEIGTLRRERVHFDLDNFGHANNSFSVNRKPISVI